MEHDLKDLFECFASDGTFLNGEPFGSGHIHETFYIKTAEQVKNDKSLCIIDLDTVMPGYFHSDFGDAIRTGANITAEDEKDLSKVKMDIVLFEAYARGYLSETRNTLNTVEKEYLAFAPLLMTFEQALRFLTDYIDGDKYYKIHHHHHNLQRTRAQMKLLESMEGQYGKMQEIIRKLM
jgi:hypothetical protein